MLGENKAIGQRVDDDDVVASGREHGGETGGHQRSQSHRWKRMMLSQPRVTVDNIGGGGEVKV